MPSIQAVFFDLYGTLLIYGNMRKAFNAWHETLTETVNSFEKNVSLLQVKEYCKSFFSFEVTGSANFTPYEIRLEKFFSDFGIQTTEVWLHKFANVSMNSWQKEIKLHPEAISTLQFLLKKKIHTGIISNFEHAPHVRQVLKDTNLAPWLNTVILSSEVKLKKPNKEIFLLASSISKISPQNILFIGDNPTEDFKGAREAGLNAILYKNGTSLKSIIKDF